MPDFLNGSVRAYLDALASGEPTPGGGSAAGLGGATAAALLCMSARFTVGREKYAAFEAAAQAVIDQAEPLRDDLQALMEADADAYAQYRAASALPKDTDAEKAARRAALQEATKVSGTVPLTIARKCIRLLELAKILATHCNPYLVSDVVVATHFALGAFHSAVINVRMNLGSLADADLAGLWRGELADMVSVAPALAREALHTAYAAMNLPFEGDFPA
jgi:formiminotetrahydrofolate cyclodeaminase